MAYYSNGSISPEHDDEEYEDIQPQKGKRKSAAGRKLVRWSPDLDQLVLLCVDHVAIKNNIIIPWDEVAGLINDYMTGEAIKQHLAKIYKYRELDGHAVPPKLDRNQRRMANRPSNGSTKSGAANTVRGRGSKKSGSDDVAEATPEPTKPGSSLLFKPPPKTKTPRRSANTPKTPNAPGRGRKNVKPIKIEDDDSDGEFGARKSKTANRGGKRGRATRREEEDLIEVSPSKKPKTNGYLRATTAVDYAEQMDSEQHEEVDGTYHEESPRTAGINQQHGLPHAPSNNTIYSQPPPQFAYPNAQSTPQHSYPATQTPINNSGTGSPHNAFAAHGYGLPSQPHTHQYQGMQMQNALMHGNDLGSMLTSSFSPLDANTHHGLGVHGISGLDGVEDPFVGGNSRLASMQDQEHIVNSTEHHDSPSSSFHPGSNGMLPNGGDDGDFILPPESLEHHHDGPTTISPALTEHGFQEQQNDGEFHALLPTQTHAGDRFDMHGSGHFSVENDMFNPGSDFMSYGEEALLGF
ncbi:hypothetical protein EJ03DRAFT_377380 [Teratosphaeria nubilosa]|uniref:Uncharacterized protein n=1 Tax=Teratosphaeria nubilosa TaxID=161662 RepID=A0A6G1KZ99_9PEZI|nr:hypothetical protein EJ03DRAFT_377380 [Teratosphaeria nubilosa]